MRQPPCLHGCHAHACLLLQTGGGGGLLRATNLQPALCCVRAVWPHTGSKLIAHSSPVHPDDPSPQSAVNATEAQLENSVVPPLYFCVTKVHIKVKRLWA